MKMENAFIHTLKSIWLCLRYPFLYPRNRFTGRHYENWKFYEYLNGKHYFFKTNTSETPVEEKGVFQKAYKFGPIDEKTFKSERITINKWYAILYQIGMFVYNYPMQWLHCIPTYTEWDAMDSMPGWKKAFGKQYLEELRAQLIKDKFLYQFRIVDIKEKYGTLRVYCACASEAVYRIIDKYEDLSYNTCYYCGKPAEIITDGYVLPYCPRCYRERDEHYHIGQLKLQGKWCDAEDIELVPQNKTEE